MAVISTPNLSSVKLVFDKGVDLNGDSIRKNKTYSSVKPEASNDDIMAVVEALVGLQEHSHISTNRIDNTSLSQ